MAYDIGPRIGIEGEKEFRTAINQINTNMKTLGTEMKAVASQFDKNDKSTEALTAKNDVLNKMIDTQKNKLSELKKGLAAAADKYGENDKVTQGWQQAVNKATADLNNMERELKNNTKAMSEQGIETEQTTEKTNKFSGALGGLGKGLANVGGTVAKAAVAGIAAVGTAALGAAAGALKLAKDVGKTADDLITLSNQTGISTKQLQEWDYAMRFIDVPMETMTKSMAKLTKNMDNAAKGTKDQTEAFKKLGVSFKDDVTGQLRNSQDVFNDLIGALGNVENETERDALAMRLFGKSAQELNPLIKAGSEELARLSEEANNVGAVLSDDALAAAGKFDDMMQTLEASTKGLVGTLGVAVIPAVTEVVNSIVGVVPKITEAIKTGDWSGAGQAVTDGLNGLLGKITNALPGLATMASTILGGLAGAIVTAVPQVLPPLIEAALLLLNTLVSILIENGPMLIQAGIDAIMMLINGIVEALPQIIDAAIQIIMALTNSLIENLPQLIDAAIKIMFALIDGILKLLPQLIEASLLIIVALANGLIDALPQLIEKIPEIVETIVNIIVENLPLIVDAALKIIMALSVALIENLPLIIESAIKIVGAIASGLIKHMSNIISFVPKLFSSLKDAFGKIKWGELGINMIKGITNGVANAAKNLAVGVIDAAKGALDGAKKFLGIKSPSTVMRDQVGKMIGAGMAEGIADSAKQVDVAMAGLNNKLTVDGSASMKTNTVSNDTPISSSNQAINIEINNSIPLDGKVVAKSTSRVQAQTNRGKTRALGAMPV